MDPVCKELDRWIDKLASELCDLKTEEGAIVEEATR